VIKGIIKRFFDIRKKNKQLLFIMLVFFLGSFAIARMFSVFVGKAIFIEGYHIHHFYFGTVALAFGGILGILNHSASRMRVASALLGIGIGLFADEIGLLLNCTTDNRNCTYFFPNTSDIILIIAIFIVFLITIIESELPPVREIIKTSLQKRER
jgi:hypothetical protein